MSPSGSSTNSEQTHENGTANGFVLDSPSEKTDAVVVSDHEKLLSGAIKIKEEKCREWKEWLKSPFFFKVDNRVE